MMRILITGHNGFIGQNLSRYLSARHPDTELFGYSRSGVKTAHIHQLVQNIDDLSAFDIIVHLAGKAHDLKGVSDPSEYFEVNTTLTQRLYDRFLPAVGQKFIFLSSVKAVTDRADSILNEQVTPDPKTPYGQSKLKAEEYLFRQPPPEGKQVYALRPTMVHGPGNKGNLNLLYNFVKKGIPNPLAAFNNKRSFLSIENLCFVIEEIIYKNIPSGIYNVCDDSPLSTSQIIGLINKVLDKKARSLHVPPSLIKFAARIGDICRLPVNSLWLDKLTADFVFDNSKIRSVLSRPLPVGAEEGIVATISSFKNLENR